MHSCNRGIKIQLFSWSHIFQLSRPNEPSVCIGHIVAISWILNMGSLWFLLGWIIYTPLKKESIAWHDYPSVKPLTNTNSTSESDSEDENRIRDDEKCCVSKLFTIRSMTLYVSMLFYPLYEVAKRCDCKIKFFLDPTVLLLIHPIQPPPKLEIKLYLLSTSTIDHWWAIATS
jgi:hypothetical protein